MGFLSGLLTYIILFIVHIGIAVLGIMIGKNLKLRKTKQL